MEDYMRWIVALLIGAGGISYFFGLERRIGAKVDREDLESLMEHTRSELRHELLGVKQDVRTLVEKEEKREEKTSLFRHDMRDSMHRVDLKIERFLRECGPSQRRNDDL